MRTEFEREKRITQACIKVDALLSELMGCMHYGEFLAVVHRCFTRCLGMHIKYTIRDEEKERQDEEGS